MVKLRLRRRGRKKAPIYDIVAADSRKSRDGAFLEKLGQYNPMTTPSTISVDGDRAIHWLQTGAQPTDTVRKLLSYKGVLLKKFLMDKGTSEAAMAEELAKHEAAVAARLDRKAQKKAAKAVAAAPAEEEIAEEPTAEEAAADADAEGGEEPTAEA